MKILIAEDDKASSILLFKLLKQFGECNVVNNGIEAVDLFVKSLDGNKPYDLIVLDLMMPVFGGENALSTIRNIEKQRGVDKSMYVKVIIASALNDKELEMELSQYDILAYFTKPLKTEQMLTLINRLNVQV